MHVGRTSSQMVLTNIPSGQRPNRFRPCPTEEKITAASKICQGHRIEPLNRSCPLEPRKQLVAPCPDRNPSISIPLPVVPSDRPGPFLSVLPQQRGLVCGGRQAAAGGGRRRRRRPLGFTALSLPPLPCPPTGAGARATGLAGGGPTPAALPEPTPPLSPSREAPPGRRRVTTGHAGEAASGPVRASLPA